MKHTITKFGLSSRKNVYLITAIIISAILIIAVNALLPDSAVLRELSGNELLEKIGTDPEPVDQPPSLRILQAESRSRQAVPETGLISLEDWNFSAAYDEIYDNRDAYYGREVKIVGYSITDETGPDGFLIGRDLLWCCASDSYFIGYLVLSEHSLIKEKENLEITGNFVRHTYHDPASGKVFEVPAIQPRSIERIGPISRSVLP